MNCKFLVVSSITYALKGKSELQAFGIQSAVEKQAELTDSQGCGYGIRINSSDTSKAVSILKNAGIRVISINKCQGQRL